MAQRLFGLTKRPSCWLFAGLSIRIHGVDPLSQVLSSVRLGAGVFSRALLQGRWAVSTAGTPDPLFHVVVRGAGYLVVDGSEPVAWRAGDLLVLPRGSAHVMCSALDVVPRPLHTLPSELSGDGLPCVQHFAEGEETLLLCGTFQVARAVRSFVMESLPDVLWVRPELDGTAAWLDTTLRMLTNEQLHHGPGSSALSGRLAEMLFIQVLRQGGNDADSGWLAAIADEQIGRALSAMHAEPAKSWTSSELASHAGMSRSVFFERFGALTGESPSHYLSRWRMVLAQQRLAEGTAIGDVADEVGYGSEAAFSRAFKRVVGLSPSRWRLKERSAIRT